MYSEIVDGKVLDYKFVKRRRDTVFYIGDIMIGQLFSVKRQWAAVSTFDNPYGPVRGFASRMAAAQYLLQVFRKRNG